ncbi:MAG TPA: ABC transporter permease [Phycisphaerae bacterium]|jgi:ribose/xylose/arabinose/galactoside ABC-type transport system permease subunit|nr:ABC transporter permease [Phycisphaerae bacterium]
MSAPTLPTSSPPALGGGPETRLSAGELLTRLGPVIGLVFVFVVFACMNPKDFLTLDNFTTILYLTTVVTTAALGMTLIIIAGGIDLSVGSSIALVTVIVAQLLCRFSTGHFYAPGIEADSPSAMMALLAALGGIGVAALAGLVIGLLVTRLKMAPFIVTLGMWSALRGAAKLLGNESMVRSPPTWLNQLLKSRPALDVPQGGGSVLFQLHRVFAWIAHMPYAVWLTAVLAVLVALMLRYTRFGRHIYAIGSNESTARLCGIRVDLMKVLIYTLGATFAGIAGILQFSFVKMGDPTTATGKELDVIAAVVVGGASLNGGRGGITGTIFGALIMSIVDNGCTNAGISNSWQQVLTGGIIIAAVAADRLRWRKQT